MLSVALQRPSRVYRVTVIVTNRVIPVEHDKRSVHFYQNLEWAEITLLTLAHGSQGRPYPSNLQNGKINHSPSRGHSATPHGLSYYPCTLYLVRLHLVYPPHVLLVWHFGHISGKANPACGVCLQNDGQHGKVGLCIRQAGTVDLDAMQCLQSIAVP